ncbi:MAG: AAA family ATPase [Dehalococcoidia bacterium]
MKCLSCGQENSGGAQFCNQCATSLVPPLDRETALQQLQETSSGFVGRRREMGELRAALEHVLSGRGRMVMLVGEPGIGKTRTAQEFARAAASQNFQVHWGRCYEEEGTPPYWPWVQILRSHLQQTDAEQLASQMGAGAVHIAEIVSEVRTKLPDLESPPTSNPEQARFRLFDSITTFFKNASQYQPLMLVLDDLHWADKSSLLLSQFLARQMGESRLLLVGIYRDVELSRQHPLSETLAQLTREPVFRRELLRGLSPEDTERFVAAIAGIEPSRRLVETIYAQTDGNPFFMSEVLRLLSEQGELTAEGCDGPQGIRIPEGVREVIGQRLNRLSEQCNQVLSTASVIGREFGFKLLSALRDDLTETMLLDLLEEALAAHVIEELPEGRESYQFGHALVQETLAKELSSSRKVRLHAHIGNMLEQLFADNIEAHASELAHHFTEAEPILGTEKLVSYSLLAGERALATHAHEEALVHFQRALTTKEGQEMDAETAATLFGLGRSHVALYHIDDAAACFQRSFDYYAETGDVSHAAAVAEFPHSVALVSRMTERLGRALTMVPPNSPRAGQLLSNYGYALGVGTNDYRDAREALDAALLIARREEDSSLEMRILANGANVEGLHFHWPSSLDSGIQAIGLSDQVDDVRSALLARLWAGHSLLAIGDLEKALQQAHAVLPLAEKMHDRVWFARALNLNVLSRYFKGDWEEARKFSDKGLAMSPADPQLLMSRVALECQVGNFAHCTTYAERLVEQMRHNSPVPGPEFNLPPRAITMIARIAGVAHQFETAQEAVQVVLSAPQATPFFIQVARSGLALMAVEQCDSGAAREQYFALEALAGTVIPHACLCVDSLLGLLAQTMGDLDQAVVRFEDALTFCRSAGYRPELAWTCCDYSDGLLQRNNPGDREQAMALLDESLSVSTELGMRPLMKRVVALQERAQSQPTKAPLYPDGLTQREVEVLQLLSGGKTDREIAEELFVSVRTVGGHVSNILNKTNSANRTEAAAYAALHGLISRYEP